MENNQPIIIKRVKRFGGGHHGGAWKIAFADFATAMMAFFLVLWLLSTATPEQKIAIAGYFKDPIGFSESGTPYIIDLGGSPELAAVKRQYQQTFIEKCQKVLAPFAGQPGISLASLWAMLGAAGASAMLPMPAIAQQGGA